MKIVKCVSGNYKIEMSEIENMLNYKEMKPVTKRRFFGCFIIPEDPAFQWVHSEYQRRMRNDGNPMQEV